MTLTPEQRDMLGELVNMGYGRAAAALSALIKQRVILSTPVVDLHSLDDAKTRFGKVLQGTVATVHQFFTGPIAGHALLVVEHETVQKLTELVTGDLVSHDELRAARRDALSEIGNILLQSAIGICGNLLQVTVSFSAPQVGIDTVDEMLSSAVIEGQELQYALLIQSRFELEQRQMAGYLVIVLGVCSLSRLLEELDAWRQRVG